MAADNPLCPKNLKDWPAEYRPTGLPRRWGAPPAGRCACFPECRSLPVLLPESFRGGFSFGAGW